MLEIMFILFYFSFACTTCPAKPIFVYLEVCFLLLFENVEFFCKFTLIYIIQIYFSTHLHLIFAPIFCGFAFHVN